METHSKFEINEQISLSLSEIEFSAIRASGPGGQSVNKTSSAIELRFAVAPSSLPESIKSRMFAISDRRLNALGVVVIKSGSHKSQKRNKDEALERLRQMILRAAAVQKKRRPTKPTRASVRKRLDGKAKRGAVKATRRRVSDGEDG